MLNLFKKKEVITYYEGELSYKEIESRLTTEQTWGTDKKIYRLFFDHLKLNSSIRISINYSKATKEII